MKTIYITIVLIIFCAFNGCKSRKPDNADTLVLFNTYRNNKIWKTDTLHLEKSIRNDTIEYLYKIDNDTLIYSFFKPADNDSSIVVYGLNCALVSQKAFTVGTDSYTIFKYHYDNGKLYNDESSLFYNKNYGLLVGYNDGWFELIFSMEYDSVSRVLIDSIINDRTGFYIRYVPPPPPSDSLIIDIG